MRVCKVCGVSKVEELFYRNDKYQDKTCKECRKITAKKYNSTDESKAKRAERNRNWRKENPEKARIRDIQAQQRRRKKLKEATVDLTLEEWLITLSYFGKCCAVCGITEDIHMDHFIPIASGKGDTAITNVIPLCARHNINKRDKHPVLWLRNESGALDEQIDKIIEYLAKMNGLSLAEYEDYVSEQYYGISYEDSNDCDEYCDEDLSLNDADNFIYEDDDWYLTMLEGRKGGLR